MLLKLQFGLAVLFELIAIYTWFKVKRKLLFYQCFLYFSMKKPCFFFLHFYVIHYNFIFTGGCDARGVPVDNLESYQPSKNKWARLKNMPTPRAGVCALSIGKFDFEVRIHLLSY